VKRAGVGMESASTGDSAAEVLSTPGWIPFDLAPGDDRPLLEWRFIGQARLSHPWFEMTVHRHRHAFGGGVRPRYTAIDVLDRAPEVADRLPLAGIIHHTSRAGSTLMTQMYACSPRLSVLSEPPIIESLIDWSHGQGESERDRLASRLQAAIGYLGRRRLAGEELLLLKAESEHALHLPLFERCFPGVPWIYLFREPAAILHSHFRQRGRQMVPFMVQPERLGKRRAEIEPARLDEYCALVLERTFEAAITMLESGRGRAVHYRRLPDYTVREAAHLFSLALTPDEVETMRARSRADSKTPGQVYAGGASREAAMRESIKALANGRLTELYERLLGLEAEAAVECGETV